MLPGYRRSRVVVRFPWPRQEREYAHAPLPLAVRPVQETEPAASAVSAPLVVTEQATNAAYEQPRGYA